MAEVERLLNPRPQPQQELRVTEAFYSEASRLTPQAALVPAGGQSVTDVKASVVCASVGTDRVVGRSAIALAQAAAVAVARDAEVQSSGRQIRQSVDAAQEG